MITWMKVSSESYSFIVSIEDDMIVGRTGALDLIGKRADDTLSKFGGWGWKLERVDEDGRPL